MNALSRNMSLSLLFLLALVSNFLISSSEPVLDTDGQPVRAGHKYYMVPPLPGAGGGLTLDNSKGRCPYEIVQTVNDHTNGLAVTFSPADKDDKEVEVDSDVNIKFQDFQDRNPCPQSKVWKFDASNQQQGAAFVMTGGVEGSPGRQTITNWFKIQKQDKEPRRSYKLQYCPSAELCDNKCRVVCGDIGVVVDRDGRKRLAVNETPLTLVFKKAPSS